MRKLLLFLIPILMLNIGYGLDLTLTNPTNSTYTSSINIPIEYTSGDNNGTCYYTINGGSQVPLPSCVNSEVTVNYDGSYLVDVHSFNDTAELNRSVWVTVDRTSEFEFGKPILASTIIGVFFGIFVVFFVITKSLKEQTPTFTAITGFISLSSLYTALFLCAAAIEEYLKSSAMSNIVGIYMYMLMALAFVLGFYGLILLIVHILNHIKATKLKT